MITKHVCSLCVIKRHLYANVAYYFLLQDFARNLSLLLHKFICVSSLICLQHWWGGKESVVCLYMCVCVCVCVCVCAVVVVFTRLDEQ